jgi:hypothetical protein
MLRFLKIIIVVLTINIFNLYSENIPFDSLNNAIGLKASNISGYGFYYNRKISDNFKIQIMGFTYYYYNKSDDVIRTIFDYDFGLELQRDIYQTKYFRIFILAGAYYFKNHDTKEYTNTKKEIYTNSYNAGVGLSGELLYKHFLLSFDLGYKFFEDNFEISESGKVTYPERKRVTKIGAGIGVGFIF